MSVTGIEQACMFIFFIYLHIHYGIYEDIGFSVVEEATNIADPRPSKDIYDGAVYFDIKDKDGISTRISLNSIIPNLVFYMRLRKKMNLEEIMTMLKYFNKDKFENGQILEAFKKYIDAYTELEIAAPNTFENLPKIMPEQLRILVHNAIMSNHDLRAALIQNGFTQELLLECEIKNQYFPMFSPNEITGLPVSYLKNYSIEDLPLALDMLKALKLFRDVTVPKVCPHVIRIRGDFVVTIMDNDNAKIAGNVKNIEDNITEGTNNINTMAVNEYTQVDVETGNTVIKSITEVNTNTNYIIIYLSMLIIYLCTVILLHYWPLIKENKYMKSLDNYLNNILLDTVMKTDTYYHNVLSKLNNQIKTIKVSFYLIVEYLKEKLKNRKKSK